MQHAQHAYRIQHACSMQHAYSMQHACNARAAGAAGACMLNVAMPTKFATAECDGRSSMRTITWCIVHRASRSVHLAACIVHLASCISPVLRALCAEGRAGAMRLRSAHEGRAVGHRQQRQQHGLLVHVVPTSGATPPYVGALQSSQVRRILAMPHALALWRMLRRVLVHTVSAAGQVVRCLPRACMTTRAG
jgi:hypothetical protein